MRRVADDGAVVAPLRRDGDVGRLEIGLCDPEAAQRGDHHGHPVGVRGLGRSSGGTVGLDAERERGHVGHGRGPTRGGIDTSSGRRLPLRMLHGAHEVTTFSQMDSPPRLRGTTWSSVSLPPLVPQYMQRQPSRAKSARREILRCSVRGTRTYWTSRMTFGPGKATVADLRGSSSSSITSAFPLNTSTCARRTVVTFKGS